MTAETYESYPILLAGGSGTRLWPVSRSLFPKQLVSFGETRSLLQETIQRLDPVFELEKVKVVCGKEHFQETARQMRDIGLRARDSIISEPLGRNTAPAVLLATMLLVQKGARQDDLLFIFPADHVVKNIKRFQEKIKAAMKLAVEGYIVTFGIEPDYPETGYGYIETAEEVTEGAQAIKRFVEKPDKLTAQKYLEAGNFYWNSGMFAFKASVIWEEFQRLTPEMFTKMQDLTALPESLSADAYRDLPNISFDYAIMEHTTKGVVLPSDFGWSDIGSWKSLHEFLDKDTNGNVIKGDVIASRTRQSLVMGQSRLIVTHDVKETVVVETPDAIFVSSLENSRDVKDIVTSLKQRARKEYQSHTTESYGWGVLKHLEEKTDSHIARLHIHPNETYRDAITDQCDWHLLVLRGRIRVHVDDGEKILNDGGFCTLHGPGRVALENIDTTEASAIRVQIDCPDACRRPQP